MITFNKKLWISKYIKIFKEACDISKEDARKMGIQIVPISVRFGNEEFLDGVEITHEEINTRLAEWDE